MTTIWADWQNIDDQGRMILNQKRSQEELMALSEDLFDGMVVTLNVTDDFEVQAQLVYDGGWWRAIPDRSTISYPPERYATEHPTE